MLALALLSSAFWKTKCSFFINLVSLMTAGSSPWRHPRTKVLSPFWEVSSLQSLPQALHSTGWLRILPCSSQSMRSGFALRPFPSHNAISVQDFLPTLVKRGDARSGFTTSSLNPCLKPKDASRNPTHCHVERSRNISNQRRNVLYCSALRIGTAL